MTDGRTHHEHNWLDVSTVNDVHEHLRRKFICSSCPATKTDTYAPESMEVYGQLGNVLIGETIENEPPRVDGRTHHAECWRGHLDCAVRRIEALEAILYELQSSAPEFDDERIGYLTVQVNRVDWNALQALELTDPRP